MVIEFKGKSLSDSCDVFLYYKKFSNKELFADLMSFNNSIKKSKDGKIDTSALVENSNFFDVFKNLYFAGRCAFEDKSIPLSTLKKELTIKTMFDMEFYNTMFEFMGGIIPEDDKKKD